MVDKPNHERDEKLSWNSHTKLMLALGLVALAAGIIGMCRG